MFSALKSASKEEQTQASTPAGVRKRKEPAAAPPVAPVAKRSAPVMRAPPPRKTINVLDKPIDVREATRKEALKVPSARAIQRMQQTEASDITRRLSTLRTWVLLAQIIQRSTADAVTADSAIALSRASANGHAPHD